jgi:hypothetical protein
LRRPRSTPLDERLAEARLKRAAEQMAASGRLFLQLKIQEVVLPQITTRDI